MYDLKIIDAGMSEHVSLAVFFLAKGLYGIDIMKIKEVIRCDPYEVRVVPHAPSMIEGVIELRGVVVPVMDLRDRLELGASPEPKSSAKYVVVSIAGKILALRVDRILGEVRIKSEQIRPSPSLLDGVGASATKYFSGVARVEQGLIFVLDLDGLTAVAAGSQ